MNRAEALRAISGIVLGGLPPVPAAPSRGPRSNEPGIFNVRDYGAKGDGVADVRNAIVSANTAAAAADGSVFFPAGTYPVSDYIDAKRETSWYGVGTGYRLIESGKGLRILSYRQGSTGPTRSTEIETTFDRHDLVRLDTL